MKSLNLKRTCLFWCIVFLSLSLHSQVTISLIQPPPNKWHIDDMWNLSLFNSGESRTIFLFATVVEVSRDLIFEGKSTTFELVKGETGRIDPYSLEPVTIDYYDKELERIIIQIGTLPPGTYTICMSVLDAETQEELSKDCYTQLILKATPPELISPQDLASLEAKNPVFVWLPSGINSFDNDITYSIIISEVIAEQTPLEAIESNPYFFFEENIPTNSLQYPISARSFDLGVKYAWQITAYIDGSRKIGKSRIWTFSTDAECEVIIDSCIISCIKPQKYLLDLYITNPISSNRNGNIYTLTIPVWQPSSANLNLIVNSPQQHQLMVASGSQIHINMTLSTDVDLTSLCFNVDMSFENPRCQVSDTICIDNIVCGNCCLSFEALINNTDITSYHSAQTPGLDEIIITDVISSNNIFQKVHAEIIQYEHSIDSSQNDCCSCICNKNPKSYGTFIESRPYETGMGAVSNLISGVDWNAGGSPFSYTASGNDKFSREVVWFSNSGVDFSNGITTNLVIGVPEYNKCGCEEVFKILIRYTFTDKTCITCDKIVEYTLIRNTSTISYLNQ